MFYELKYMFAEMLQTHISLFLKFCAQICLHPCSWAFLLCQDNPSTWQLWHSWLNRIIIRQVHLVMGTMKGHSKMCCFVTQHNATYLKFWASMQLVCWLQECPPELLPETGMFIPLPYAASNVVLENLAVRPTGFSTADHLYGVVWASGLLLWTECPWWGYGQA